MNDFCKKVDELKKDCFFVVENWGRCLDNEKLQMELRELVKGLLLEKGLVDEVNKLEDECFF